MIPVLVYRLGLLLRSARWLPPFLLWAVIVVAGTLPGQGLTEAVAYNSMALVPSTAWLTRSLLLVEPEASRWVLVAARGAVRVHLASLAAAVVVGCVLTVLGLGAAVATAGLGDLTGASGGAGATTVAACGAAGVVCVLVGVASGAVCTTVMGQRRGLAITTTGILAVAALVATGSPANAAVTSVADVPRSAATSSVLVALVTALVLACGVATLTSLMARSRQ